MKKRTLLVSICSLLLSLPTMAQNTVSTTQNWSETASSSAVAEGGLVEIPIAQQDESTQKASMVKDGDVTTFTTGDQYVNVVFKMLKVDVTDCDYIIYKFAEPVPEGFNAAFWGTQDMAAISAGSTEYKYVFKDDPKNPVANGVIPEVSVITLGKSGITMKLKGVYKHSTVSTGVNAVQTGKQEAKKAVKRVVDGKVVIDRGDKAFGVNGAEIKP